MAHLGGVGIADAASGSLLHILPSPPKTGMVTSLCAASGTDSSGTLLVGHEDGSLAVWMFDYRSIAEQTPKLVARRQLSKEPLLALAFSSKAQTGVAAGPLASLLPFKIRSEVLAQAARGDEQDHSIGRRKPVELPKPGTNCLALRSDGRLLAAGAWDGRVRIFEFPSCRPLATLKVLLCVGLILFVGDCYTSEPHTFLHTVPRWGLCQRAGLGISSLGAVGYGFQKRKRCALHPVSRGRESRLPSQKGLATHGVLLSEICCDNNLYDSCHLICMYSRLKQVCCRTCRIVCPNKYSSPSSQENDMSRKAKQDIQ